MSEVMDNLKELDRRLDAHLVKYATLQAELTALRATNALLREEVSMLQREVSREGSLRFNVEKILKQHIEYCRENRLLDDTARADAARAATDAAKCLEPSP